MKTKAIVNNEPDSTPKYCQTWERGYILKPISLAITNAIYASKAMDTNTPTPSFPGKPASTILIMATSVITFFILDSGLSPVAENTPLNKSSVQFESYFSKLKPKKLNRENLIDHIIKKSKTNKLFSENDIECID